MSTSIFDVRIDGGPSLREIVGDDIICRQFEVWEKTQNQMIKAGIDRQLCAAGTSVQRMADAFNITGQIGTAERLGKVANTILRLTAATS